MRCSRSATRRCAVLAAGLVVLLGTGCTGGSTNSASSGSTVVASTPPGTADGLVAIGAGLRGPSGLVASVDATGMANVAALAFDGEGRLWAATADFEDKGADAVYVIPAAGAAPVKVIDHLHTALGLLWIGDSLFVASKEQVEVYRGFDGTTFASREVIVDLPDKVGEVNGLALGPDGRLRLGISAPCDSCAPTLPQSGTVVSFRPDGSDVQVEAKGIRAPIGLAYYPGTNDLFVTMNQRDDLGDATPGDWLSVVRAGQVWGFPDCYGQGGAACAGAPSPVAALDPHAALSGVAVVTGQLGPAVGTAAIVAEWAEGKVQRVALDRAGDGYTGTVSPFLTGIEKPVPVVLGPDGALYVGDWQSGTVYRVGAIGSAAGSAPS